MAVAEELGNINCGAIPMAIGVQSDMATPALARFGSDQLKKDWLAPTIAGDMVVCLGVSEPSAGSDVASECNFVNFRSKTQPRVCTKWSIQPCTRNGFGCVFEQVNTRLLMTVNIESKSP